MSLSSSAPASGWRLVGKIKEAHGLRGDLYALIFSGEAAWDDELTEFCLASNEELTDQKFFEVERLKPFKKGLLIKPKNIPDRTAAEPLKGQLFFIPEELLQASEGDAIFLDEILGFEARLRAGKTLGAITGFSSNNAQDLLLVEMQGRQVEIPFVEAFVVEISHSEKRVTLDLPEGLLELNLPQEKKSREEE
jgi:16S rRNA processing protein RimM